MDFRPSSLLSLALVAAMLGPFFLPSSADARNSSRRNYSAEWENERREEERSDRRAAREDAYYEHKERQLDVVLEAMGPGPSRRSAASAGRTCMYGMNGEVILRPAGVTCKGDSPAASATRSSSSQAQPAKVAAKKPTKGRCIYGKSGKVLWSEPGAEC